MKAFCKRGHPLSGDNLYVSPKGFRQCRMCSRSNHTAYRKTPKGRFAAKSRDLREAGWTLERHDQFLVTQNGRCAICKIEFESLVKKPACDHDHLTNTPRGLLCNDCNAGLGFLKDNPSILASAIEYLQQWKVKP
jgi:hypothetical protein